MLAELSGSFAWAAGTILVLAWAALLASIITSSEHDTETDDEEG